MWETPLGTRILKGAEGRLVHVAGALMYERFKDSYDSYECGSGSFDDLDVDQQVLAILTVTQRLTDETPSKPREAWADSTVLALFTFIQDQIAFEIEMMSQEMSGNAHFLRRLVRDALSETHRDPRAIPLLDGENQTEWNAAVMLLADLILGSRDFLRGNELENQPQFTEYFSAYTPDWTPSEKRTLHDLYLKWVEEADAAYLAFPN